VNTAWSYAVMANCNCPLMDAIASLAIRNLRQFTATLHASLVWSVAALFLCHDPLLTAISASSLRICSECDAQGLAHTAWAFSLRCIMVFGPLRDALAAASLRNITAFGAQHIVSLSWAFAGLTLFYAPLFESIVCAVIVKVFVFILL